MKPTASLAALSLLAATACVPRPQPTPPVQARPTPAPVPAPPPAPAPANWLDAPQTPGDWSYRTETGGGIAQFTSSTIPIFVMRCDAAAGAVVLTHLGASFGPEQMTIRTESQSRTLSATSSNSDGSSRLLASDRLLDAIALSKGRFAVEIPSARTLYLPSWAEVTRVIEDCR